MFGWNLPRGSGEEDFSISSIYFRRFVIIYPWKRTRSFIRLASVSYIPKRDSISYRNGSQSRHFKCFVPSLVEIGPVVPEKKNMKSLQTDGRTTGDQKSFQLRWAKKETWDMQNIFPIWTIWSCPNVRTPSCRGDHECIIFKFTVSSVCVQIVMHDLTKKEIMHYPTSPRLRVPAHGEVKFTIVGISFQYIITLPSIYVNKQNFYKKYIKFTVFITKLKTLWLREGDEDGNL